MNSAIGLRRLWTVALVVSGLLGTGCFGLTADEDDDSSEQALDTSGGARLPISTELPPGALQAGPVPNPWAPCEIDPTSGVAQLPQCLAAAAKAR